LSASCFGIIAGNGRYPLLLAQELVRAGHSLAVASFETETIDELKPVKVFSHPVIGKHVEAARSFRLGEVDRLFAFLALSRAREFYLAGGIDRKGLWSRIRPDMTAVRIALRSGITRDDDLLARFAQQGGKWSLVPGDPRPYIRELLLPEGHVAGPEPDPELNDLVEKGKSALDKAGKNTTGQAVLAFDGGVIMETFRGTDSLMDEWSVVGAQGPTPPKQLRLRRLDLAPVLPRRAVLVKLPRPGQDLRFDMPAIGPETVETAGRCGVRVIAGRAGETLLLDRDKACDLAGKLGVAIMGLQ